MSTVNPRDPRPQAGKRGAKLALAGAPPSLARHGARAFSRDLSWLEFNRRVLAQAADERVPLLERVKFLAIFTSNLDEFFMKRVGLIKRQVHAGVDTVLPSGHTPQELLAAVRDMVEELQIEQARIYEKSILPALEAAGICVVAYSALGKAERRWADDYFRSNIFPALTPLAVDPGHRFPFISNLSENLALLASVPSLQRHGLEEEERHFARVKIPHTLRKFIALPGTAGARNRFITLPDLIRNNLDDLFPGTQVHEVAHFRVTRSAGIQRDDVRAKSATLLDSVEAELKQRRFARAVRIEVEPNPSEALIKQLEDKLSLGRNDVYERPGPMDYAGLYEIADLDRSDLKPKPWRGVTPARLNTTGKTANADFFAAIRRQDILLHHPYESFTHTVERFIEAAAADPDVLTIKQTLYRTGLDSPFVVSMIRAAEAGKQVACLIELRARFDEDRNVRLARQLEKAGVHVAYGVVGLKTHCKTSLVVRKERQGLRCYAHVGTGNYHPKTAQLYTDVGLLTSDPEITSDLVSLFNSLTGLAPTQNYSALLVAPFNMRQRFVAMIHRERDNAKAGRPARIWAKLNSLEDLDVTEQLYEAAQAGVKVFLVVRGFCSLRPGVQGLSENIRVVSVVGRFLEHSRIFHFANGEEDALDGEWYIGSADWMYRNLNTRVEAACPVRDRAARMKLCRILEVSMQDHLNAWDLNPDGSYRQRTPPTDAKEGSPAKIGTFEALMAESGG